MCVAVAYSPGWSQALWVTQGDFTLLILLPASPKCCDYTFVSTHLGYSLLALNPGLHAQEANTRPHPQLSKWLTNMVFDIQQITLLLCTCPHFLLCIFKVRRSLTQMSFGTRISMASNTRSVSLSALELEVVIRIYQ